MDPHFYVDEEKFMIFVGLVLGGVKGLATVDVGWLNKKKVAEISGSVEEK